VLDKGTKVVGERSWHNLQRIPIIEKTKKRGDSHHGGGLLPTPLEQGLRVQIRELLPTNQNQEKRRESS